MYIPLTHLERWIPLASAVLYLMLMGYALLAPVDKKEQQSTQQQAQSAPQQQQKPAAPQKPNRSYGFLTPKKVVFN